MKKIQDFFKRIKLTQDLAGFGYFENFLVATVLTILLVRFFLEISGYPQIGGSGLHIAHMLWGGLLLLICLLLMFLFMDRRIKTLAAILGGIGFGLFIDELGKFITSDNNYFFQPTVALIYMFFVLLFLVMHLLKSKMTIASEEYLSNFLDIFRNSLVHGMTAFERNQATEYLKKSGKTFSLEEIFDFTKEKDVNRKEAFLFIAKYKEKLESFLDWLTSKRSFQILVISLIELQAFLSFGLVLFIVLYYTGILSRVVSHGVILDLDFASSALIASSFLAGLLAIIGAFNFPRSKKRAFTYIKYSLFISIFIVQFFIFWINQFSALIGLMFNVVALLTVNVILAKYELGKNINT